MYAWCTIHCAVGCIWTHVHIFAYTYVLQLQWTLLLLPYLRLYPMDAVCCACATSQHACTLLGVLFLLSPHVSSPYRQISSTYSFHILILPAFVLPISSMHALAGGLFTGAEALKTVEERKLYGGFANAPYDPCYHQVCVRTCVCMCVYMCVCVCLCVCMCACMRACVYELSKFEVDYSSFMLAAAHFLAMSALPLPLP